MSGSLNIKRHDGDDSGSASTNSNIASSSGEGSRSTKDDGTTGVARKESVRIYYLRVLLVFVLFLATFAASYVIFKVTRKGEDDQFETSYHDSAIKIIDSFEANLRHTIGAIDNYAIVTSTQANKEVWPFHSAAKFEVGGASTRTLAGAGLLSVIPLVTEAHRVAWEQYSVNNSGWVQDGIDFNETGHLEADVHDHEDRAVRRKLIQTTEELDEDHEDEDEDHVEVPANFSQGIANTIFLIDPHTHEAIVDDTDAPYWPMWQTTPAHEELVNYNIHTHGSFGKDLEEAAASEQIVFGRIADVSDIHDPFNFLYHAADVHEEEGHEEEGHEEEGREEEGHEEEEDEDGHEEEGHDDHRLLNLEEEDHEEEDHEEEGHEDEEEKGVVGGHDDHSGEDEHFGDYGDPLSMTFFPIFDHIDKPRNVVGVLAAAVYWRDYLVNVLPQHAQPVYVVLENGCGQEFSFRVVGERVDVLGEGDKHEARYDHEEISFHLDWIAGDGAGSGLTFSGVDLNVNYCPYSLRIFPTTEMRDFYYTNKPGLYAVMIVATFVFASAVFLCYDILVARRQKKISQRAQETSAVVNSLFPANVRERMFRKEKEAQQKRGTNVFLHKEAPTEGSYDSLPIADLFPNSTVMFADIAGFTAWSSSREPTQVFILLESIYGKFDKLAKKLKVFKIETIGDCYVAVTGVPVAQADHAVIMARFAFRCLDKMNQLTRELEVTLGPDTADLTMRFGLHSGPVTAGVLRGEKSRFQLFGDTVNTASRMESTGIKNRIHCSKATAESLIVAGKSRWLKKREDYVHAKGKGVVQTYWITPGTGSTIEDGSSNPEKKEGAIAPPKAENEIRRSSSAAFFATDNGQMERLIDWNLDMLHKLLKKLVASRGVMVSETPFSATKESKNPIDEVKEAIGMPPIDTSIDPKALNSETDTATAELCPQALSQLRDYVTTIAYMYQDNPFHNFDHASHVSLSAQKMLNRLVPPTRSEDKNTASDLNDNAYAYGITSDPLTHFAVIFSTMIHDVDHSGVSNGQLIKEGTDIAKVYENKSVAEQNSIDVAWELLMESSYEELRKCIFPSQQEYDRFRSLVVNSVIATDIFDKDLKAFRNRRWEKAFQIETTENDNDNNLDLKATIVIEHLLQASDVCHTMQHWHVYQKWNERFFNEVYSAYQSGRAGNGKDPSEGWYDGELWFYDNYIIPLAKKLKECGVFGVSSDEYLNYAKDNRWEWEFKGKGLVEQWKKKYKVPTVEPKLENAGDVEQPKTEDMDVAQGPKVEDVGEVEEPKVENVGDVEEPKVADVVAVEKQNIEDITDAEEPKVENVADNGKPMEEPKYEAAYVEEMKVEYIARGEDPKVE